MIFVKTFSGKLVADVGEIILAYSLRKATEVRCDCSKCEVS